MKNLCIDSTYSSSKKTVWSISGEPGSYFLIKINDEVRIRQLSRTNGTTRVKKNHEKGEKLDVKLVYVDEINFQKS
jgi:hypothetical protein